MEPVDRFAPCLTRPSRTERQTYLPACPVRMSRRHGPGGTVGRVGSITSLNRVVDSGQTLFSQVLTVPTPSQLLASRPWSG
jgi:hypothetical protein